MSELELDIALQLLPSSYKEPDNPLVYMARTALYNGADPKAIIEGLISALVDENNRSRPQPREVTNHYWPSMGVPHRAISY